MTTPDAGEQEDSPTVIRTFNMDAIVAAILFIFGAVVVVEARRLGSSWTSDGPGAGYFPFYIGLILCISSVGILWQTRWGASRDEGTFVDRLQLKRVMSVLLPAMVYVLAVNFLGLYVASAIYIALFMILLGDYPPVKSVVVSVIVIAVFFAMFEVWFKVPLFKGSLEPLSFLGY